MPGNKPSIPVITKSTDKLLLSTCGLIVATVSAGPALSHVTDEMMSGNSFTNASTMGPVSFWSPPVSRICRLTGVDGLAGMAFVSPDGAGAFGVPAFGAAQPVIVNVSTATTDAKYVLLLFSAYIMC